MPVRTSAVESETMTPVYEQTPQFRTAVDQLAEKARIQDDVRVFEEIAPQIETAYTENVEPYL